MSAATATGADFDSLSWHDCHLWGIELRAGDAETGDWTSDLALDIDLIVEWICGPEGSMRFRVAPATLIFHGVTDLSIAVTQEQQGAQVALHPWSMDRVERTPVADRKLYLDRPYYRGLISLNWPKRGEILFGAWSFTQTLRAEPLLTERQHLARLQRAPAAAR